MTRDPREYVDHIEECIDHIEQWVAEGRHHFLQDVRTQAAVLRKLQELAESLSRLEPLVADRYAEVPWREVRAFRNVIVHDYLGLNLDRIWDIASRHVRELKPHIASIGRDLRDPMA